MSVLRMTPEQLAQHNARLRPKKPQGESSRERVDTQPSAAKSRSKYRNVITYRHGLKFHSIGEADRWDDLLLMESAGEIRSLIRQVPFEFALNDVMIGKYVADFVYDEKSGSDWIRIVEDFKGKNTDLFELKKQLMLAFHNIEIRQTRRK